MTWCSTDDVTNRLVGDVHPAVISSAAEIASSILYMLSGRSISEVRGVDADIMIDRRGRIPLRDWQPIRSVTSVEINGIPASFALSPAKSFVILSERLAGYVARVALLYGSGVPEFAREAAAALTRELIRTDPSYDASDKKVDPRLAAVSRQGVSWTYQNVNDSIKESLTAVYEVDMFLKAVNPQGARYQPRVVAP